MGIPEVAIIGGYPVTVVRVPTGLDLVDKITHGQGVRLVGTEDQGFFLLIDQGHENLDPLALPLHDFDDAVEILFFVASAGLDFPLHDGIIRGVDVLIQGSGDLLDAKWSQKAIVDALLQ